MCLRLRCIRVTKSDKRKAGNRTMLNEGDKAPDFELPETGGGTLKLSKLSGRIVVVYFYPKDNTSGCTKEAAGFSERHHEFVTAGAEVIGISPDDLASHQKFRDKHDLAVRLVADEDKRAISAYGVWVEKSMYGRKYMGVERATFLIGRDGKIARIWRKVKIPGHVAEVLATAQAI
jgi:thioredoxin-dependent peroxiredoxin